MVVYEHKELYLTWEAFQILFAVPICTYCIKPIFFEVHTIIGPHSLKAEGGSTSLKERSQFWRVVVLCLRSPTILCAPTTKPAAKGTLLFGYRNMAQCEYLQNGGCSPCKIETAET